MARMAGSSSQLSSACVLRRCRATQAWAARSMIISGTGIVPPRLGGQPDGHPRKLLGRLAAGLAPWSRFRDVAENTALNGLDRLAVLEAGHTASRDFVLGGQFG